jgi:transcriptional regulator with XRE-family HTH domain
MNSGYAETVTTENITIEDIVRENLRVLRKEAGYTQAELCKELANQGLVTTWDKNAVMWVETGRRHIKIFELYALRKLFDVPLWRFFVPTPEQADLRVNYGDETFAAWELLSELLEPPPSPNHDILTFTHVFINEVYKRDSKSEAATRLMEVLRPR